MWRYRMTPVYIALLAVSVLFLFPFYWVLICSLKSPAGLDLLPPAMYPAEAQTQQLRIPGGRNVVEADGGQWLLLARSKDLIGGSGLSGGYYVQIEKGEPSQLVSWFSDDQTKPVENAPSQVVFKKASVHRSGSRQLAIPAKLVRQEGDQFQELLFAAPAGAGQTPSLEVLRNVPHTEMRKFEAHWENYPKTLKGPEATIGEKSQGFLLYMRNSLFVSIMAVLGQVLSSSLVAFGFARIQFKGREVLFVLLLATLMVPAQVTLIPLFAIYKTVGWVNTFLPLIVPHFTAGAFNVFLIRQFLLTIPRELDESAVIDGATPWRIYWNVILPNCASVLIVVGLFTFVGSWQDVMGPLIYLDNPAFRTVTLGLEYFRSPYVDNRHLLMTGAVLAMIPVAGLFLVGQRYIMSGIATTGMKN